MDTLKSLPVAIIGGRSGGTGGSGSFSNQEPAVYTIRIGRYGGQKYPFMETHPRFFALALYNIDHAARKLLNASAGAYEGYARA